MEADYLSQFKTAEALLPVIVQNIDTKEVLMLAWVNKYALELSINTKFATFWSRSRNEIWVKGETSGNRQEIVNINYDCDSDAFLFQVHSHGPACHTGATSCFYREIKK